MSKRPSFGETRAVVVLASRHIRVLGAVLSVLVLMKHRQHPRASPRQVKDVLIASYDVPSRGKGDPY